MLLIEVKKINKFDKLEESVLLLDRVFLKFYDYLLVVFLLSDSFFG